MTPDMPALAEMLVRLKKLERQNRRFKLAGITVLVLAAAGLMMGLASPKDQQVEAERFVVRDASGKVRALFGVTPNGDTLLALSDQNGTMRVGLFAYPDGVSSLTFADKNGKDRATLAVSSDLHVGLVLKDQAGEVRAGLNVSADGSSALALGDKNGTNRAMLTLMPNGEPGLLLSDQAGNIRSLMHLGADGSPQLKMVNKDAQTVFTAP